MPGPVRPTTHEPYIPTSVVLDRLIRTAPAEHVTLAWLLAQLGSRAFGVILLVLGVCGMLPGVSPVAGALLVFPAVQMIRAHQAPTFPQRFVDRPVATDRVAALLKRISSALRRLERFVRPRWPTPFRATKRVVGGAVLLLGIGLLAPIPLSNIPIGLTIVLLAFAYLEEDGALVALALTIAVGLFAAAVAVLWGMVATTVWLAG